MPFDDAYADSIIDPVSDGEPHSIANQLTFTHSDCIANAIGNPDARRKPFGDTHANSNRNSERIPLA